MMSSSPQQPPFTIVVDPLESNKVAWLLREHLEGMADHSPPENIHALDLSRLRAPDITFWTAWKEDELLGCGAFGEYQDNPFSRFMTLAI